MPPRSLFEDLVLPAGFRYEEGFLTGDEEAGLIDRFRYSIPGVTELRYSITFRTLKTRADRRL
jgi:hypothetical protein